MGLACALIGAGAFGQAGGGEADEPVVAMRQQIERLNQRVGELEAELEAANVEAVALAKQVQRLRSALADAERMVADADDGVDESASEGDQGSAIDLGALVTDGVMESPETLIAAVRAAHAEEFGAVSIEQDRDRLRYMRELSAWAALQDDSSSAISGAVRWTCAVEWVTPIGDGLKLRLAVLDLEKGALATQRRIDVRVRGDLAERVRTDADQAVWLLEGYVTSKIRVNPERLEAGYFDDPPFVGPMAEYVPTFDVVDMRALSPGNASASAGD